VATASTPKNGIVLIFDLEGFSKFFSQPDVHYYVPRFLNHIFRNLDAVIYGGKADWEGEPVEPMDTLPIHKKYLGDGALLVWTFPGEVKDFVNDNGFVGFLNRIWNYKNSFQEVIRACREEVPLAEVPSKIRFGLAAGSIYELTRDDSPNEKEYVGYCINLASRLQSYCKELGFIASAKLEVSVNDLSENGYKRVIAKNLVGFPREIVIVDKKEFEALDPKIREELFEELP